MNLLLLLIIFLAFYIKDFRGLIVVSFLLGLVTDLYHIDSLGFTSLIFLSMVLLIFLYRQKFSSSHLVFQLAFTLLSDRLYTLLKGERWTALSSLVIFFLSLIIFSLINRIKGNLGSGLELEV